jgi:hypothetical protein
VGCIEGICKNTFGYKLLNGLRTPWAPCLFAWALLVVEKYEIFCLIKVTGNGAFAITANPHKGFNGLEKGRLSHDFSLILETRFLKTSRSLPQVNVFKAVRLFINNIKKKKIINS